MRTTFFGLEIGRKALMAQSRALDTTGHNIANANTQGYTRQEVILEASKPVKISAGYVGTGVEIAEVRRIRDEYIDLQIRTENKATGYWQSMSDTLSKVEVVLNEPSDSGLRSVMDKFWEGWQELSKNPESNAVRATVYQRGVSVAEAFNHMDRQLKDLQADIDGHIEVKVNEINSIATQIKDLNELIVRAEAQGNVQANDLRDQRDLLVEEMSSIIDIDMVEDKYGSISVTIGGRAIVSGGNLAKIGLKDDPANNNLKKLIWVDPKDGSNLGIDVRIGSGSIKGLIQSRDEIVGQEVMTRLNDMAKVFADELNVIHASGLGLNNVTGTNFFTFGDSTKPAGTITVNPVIENNLDLIAAKPATAGVEDNGDGSNALTIANLKQKELNFINGNSTTDDTFRSIASRIGIRGQEASRMVDNQELLIDQLHNKRDAISGVSLDEEMTNMIKFQHSYNAAARLITVMDEMIDTIVNRLGVVGR